MQSLLKTVFAVLMTLSLLAASAFPQMDGGKLLGEKPFVVGETAQYDVKWSKIIQGITVADLRFTLSKNTDSDNLEISAEAKSKGTLFKLARFTFLQQYKSIFDPEKFRVLKTTKHDVQKDRVRDGEAIFDYAEKQVAYVESDPKEPMRPPRKIASSIEPQTQDILSGLYYLRSLPLAVGKTFEITVSDSGLVFQIPVKVIGRELQKTALGKVWCFRIEPDVFGPGRMIEKEGTMIIWITDDARRVPVRSRITSDIGKIEIKIKSAANLKS